MKQSYVTERGQNQWVICRWDEQREIYTESVNTYTTRAEAEEAMEYSQQDN